jgi:hypothetical protein
VAFSRSQEVLEAAGLAVGQVAAVDSADLAAEEVSVAVVLLADGSLKEPRFKKKT